MPLLRCNMMLSIGIRKFFASTFCAVQQSRRANVKKLTFGLSVLLAAQGAPASPTLAVAQIT